MSLCQADLLYTNVPTMDKGARSGVQYFWEGRQAGRETAPGCGDADAGLLLRPPNLPPAPGPRQASHHVTALASLSTLRPFQPSTPSLSDWLTPLLLPPPCGRDDLEAFPASTAPGDRTTYLFHYTDTHPERLSITECFEDYWELCVHPPLLQLLLLPWLLVLSALSEMRGSGSGGCLMHAGPAGCPRTRASTRSSS